MHLPPCTHSPSHRSSSFHLQNGLLSLIVHLVHFLQDSVANMFLSLLLIVFYVIIARTGVHALSIPSSHALHEKRETQSIEVQWVKRGRIPTRATLPMRVGLRQENLENGYNFLMDV